MQQRLLTLICFAFIWPATTAAQSGNYLYRTTLLQAAPGKLAELIDAQKKLSDAYRAAGEPAPWMIRHSQGDMWDLLLLTPASSLPEYFAAERVAKRKAVEAGTGWAARRSELIAWQEDVYALGPPPSVVGKAFAELGYFHVEMFIALPGKHAELVKQREMENAYFKGIDRPQNLVFVRETGAAWDAFTIGAYRDLKHYAESADISDEKEEASAHAAGFASAGDIGLYLRTLIRSHHDTLAVPVR